MHCSFFFLITNKVDPLHAPFHFRSMSGWTRTYVDSKLQTRRIIVFGKSNDPDSQQVKRVLGSYSLSHGNDDEGVWRWSSVVVVLESYEWIDIEKRQDCRQIENYLRFLSGTDRRQVKQNGLSFPRNWLFFSRRLTFSSMVSTSGLCLNWRFAIKIDHWSHCCLRRQLHACLTATLSLSLVILLANVNEQRGASARRTFHQAVISELIEK